MLRRSARFSHANPTFLAPRVETCFFFAVPETTIFIVVPGPHTEMGLAGVPETTTKIVVSGTCGEREKPAEPKKGANQE